MITAPSPSDAPVGIYIHVPFCAHICPYCDFNTYAGKDDLIPRYVDAVVRELEMRAGEVGSRPAATVYFGGGTPSLLSPDQIGTLLDAVRANYTVLPDAEITMEANPNGLDDARLAGYRSTGVDRMSIGAQTLDRRGLRRLGRQHEATDVLDAVRAARAAGFDRLNLDFIFGWPGQDRAIWQDDLRRVLELGDDGPDHLSLYSLIIEPGTPYADAAARGILRIPDDDEAADLYEDAIAILADAGWDHYEIANWARTPDRYSRHNAIYWQHGDYLGIGAGAFGTVGGRRTMNQLLPERYVSDLESGALPHSNTESIEGETALGETMMLGLRLLNDGIDANAFATRHGVGLDDHFGSQIQRMREMGLLERTDRGVRLTPRGMMLANDVAAEFL
ncbi:MAG TPA: radical SAM family heme chaperone HemW [Thermomicrobiales bacterium]|jgi:oxygen-independent coproporphyrinogen-3 oxidase|nr:radical SAM family heme chaperone HemW [Thermomicrobiales bacterium]